MTRPGTALLQCPALHDLEATVRTNKNYQEQRPVISNSLAFGVCLLAACQLHAAALQVDEPWQTTGSNTGTVGNAALTAVSAQNRWESEFRNNDIGVYTLVNAFGSNALPAGTIGDLFTLRVGPFLSDTFTITLNDAIIDPIFYFVDLDADGSSITVPDGGTNFTNNSDAQWNGNTLLKLSDLPMGSPGGFGAVKYLGTFGPQESFVFELDYDLDGFGSELIGIGVGVIPLPPALLLFGSALGALAWWRRRPG